MNIKSIVLLFASIVGVSCNSQKIRSQCDKNTFFSKGLAFDSEIRNSDSKEFVTAFFSSLDTSDYLKAYNIVNTYSKLYKDSLNQYSFLKPIKGLTSKESHYIVYRLEQYLGNITEKMLNNELTKIYNSDLEGTDSIVCLNKLSEIEFAYLSFYSLHDSLKKKEHLQKFVKYLKEYPKSFRIQYLYAKLNYEIGKYEVALPFFKNLLREKYYENSILESLVEYYSQKSIDTAMYYTKIFSNRFPTKCNLGKLNTLIKGGIDSSFMEECEKCLKSEKAIDSIKSKIALSRFYLEKMDLKKVAELYDDYKNNNTENFDFSESKVWERGEYYDIFLRTLFLQNKFVEIYKFIVTEVGYNKKIKIDNEMDFYKLMEKYHSEYYKSNFEKFYDKNFHWIKRQLLKA